MAAKQKEISVKSLTGLSLLLSQKLSSIQSEGDIFPALDSILMNLCEHVELDAAALMIRRNKQEPFVDAAHEIRAHGLKSLEKETLNRYFTESLISEMASLSKCMRRDDVRSAFVGTCGPRTKMVSMLAMPIQFRGAQIAVFTVFRSEISAFCEEDEVFFQRVATLLGEEIETAIAFLQFAKDSLTSFYSRRMYFEAAALEVARARRYQSPLSVLFMDAEVMSSEPIESVHGKQIIKRLAQRISSEVRQSDLVCRASDYLFFFLLPMTESNRANELAVRLCNHIQRYPVIINENPIPMNLSFGISSLNNMDDSAISVLERADLSLSMARKSGINQIVFLPE